MPYAKNHIRVKVPSRSGFDKSHRNSGTSFCGTLTPLLLDELIPNSRVSLKVPIAVQLPPLASDTFMNVKYAVEAFFVPMRLLCASFEDFFCDFPRRVFTQANPSTGAAQSAGSFSNVKAKLPVFRLVGGSYDQYIGPGSLLDYLGFRANIAAGETFDINPLPLVAYHLVWQEYYRNPRVQNPAFAPSLGMTPNYRYGGDLGFAFMPYNYFHASFSGAGGVTSADNSLINIAGNAINSIVCADGVNGFALRQRNFGLDYFTGARTSAQQGDPLSVSVDIPASQDIEVLGGTGSFTIAQLRAANSLQQFRERNNIPSPRLVDQVKARYNANLSDGVAQRPICIGSAKFDVSTYGINQTSEGTGSGAANPFSSVASQYGRGSAQGNSFVIENFVANEPGYILVLGSLVPEASYSSGVPRLFKRYLANGSITDMACALLQNVGDQPIFDYELVDTLNSSEPTVFGFQDRYADFMFMPNQIHGLMRENQSLESFVLQRSFSSSQLSSSFLEIPKNYMDGVMATSAALAGMTYWYDTYLQYRVSMPLAEFSIPSLQDPAYEHGESVNLRRNGQIF